MASHFYLSAGHKSSGKTTLSLALARAYSDQGLNTQCFKKGPDYIDPLWLSQASRQACYNLDFNTQDESDIQALYALKTARASISFVEGNKGLFDGMSVTGEDSNAALADALNLPVILVIDCVGMTRGIAPLLQGYCQFDDTHIAGVILNKVGGERHEKKLRAAIEHYTDLSCLGAVPKQTDLQMPERHLGLLPAVEAKDAEVFIANAAHIVANHVDLPSLQALTVKEEAFNVMEREPQTQQIQRAYDSRPVSSQSVEKTPQSQTTEAEFNGIKIGVMKDASFCFYYADDFERMRALGSQLLFIDAMHDADLPEVDALFIGGGFPETHAQQLSDNVSMRESVAQAIELGLPCYAECGGLMYLTQSIEYQGDAWPMVGVFQAAIKMDKRPYGRGYVSISPTSQHPWPNMPDHSEIAAHEFHYSCFTTPLADWQNAALSTVYQVNRGYGIDGTSDGLHYKHCVANYSHFRSTPTFDWVWHFMAYIKQCHAQQR